MLAIAQDGDAIGDLQRFLERMGNKDNGDASLLEIENQVEEIFLLLRRQRRCRLVEYYDFDVVQHCPRDFDHLLLGRAEQTDGRSRRDIEIKRLQELLRGDINSAQSVEELLLAEKQILRHRHRRNQAVLLKDHGDAEMPCLGRRARIDFLALDQHLARGQRHDAGHHLCQRRFAGAILADQSMDFRGHQREIDGIDCRNAGIFLRRLTQFEDRSCSWQEFPFGIGDIVSRNRSPASFSKHEKRAATFDRRNDAVILAVDAAVKGITRQSLRGQPMTNP